ncbi:hypothetical protein LX64_04094 [Chitinophaga skermanii]|uniref:Uncharacterized protein n=1 Tax=Chitinophaga skermanii TaxID=331697 RepID=A0A327Q7B7_9BACT|nr:hypothetical protein LX64_04094 [Chitinophaga skermanii]
MVYKLVDMNSSHCMGIAPGQFVKSKQDKKYSAACTRTVVNKKGTKPYCLVPAITI